MHPNETTLNDYVDGSLGPAQRSDVDRHLAACAACRQLVEDLGDIVRATGELELREPPVRAWSRLERAIRMEGEHTAAAARRLPLDGARASASGGTVNGSAKGGRYGIYATWLAAAAALVLATMVGMRYMPTRHTDAP